MVKRDPVFTPELVRILKIFGSASILLVLILSFFNSYRADNTGEDRTFRMSDSARLYFLNVKSIVYECEIRSDAGMSLFRHEDLLAESGSPSIQLILILNPPQDEAYLYLEPVGLDWPLEILVEADSTEKMYVLDDGNKFEHGQHIQKLRPYLESNARFYIFDQGQKIPIWTKEVEKEGLKRTLEDYFRIIET